MATIATIISGLQSPNPYAPSATMASARAQPVVPTRDVAEATVSNHPSYSPDWMQAEHVSTPQTPVSGIYSMKGELQKLP